MKNTTVTKTKLNQKAPTSFDVSYAEILAEVQKLQQMLDGNLQAEKKPRKKRTLKAKVEQNPSEPIVEQIQSQSDDVEAEATEQQKSEVKASTHRYKVSNLDEIREKISEVKDLIEEADPAAAEIVAANAKAEEQSQSDLEPKAEAQAESSQSQLVSEPNAEAQPESASQSQSDSEPKAEAQSESASQAQLDSEPNAEAQPESASQAQLDSEPKAETQPETVSKAEEEQARNFQTTQEAGEKHGDIKHEAQTAIDSVQDNEPVAKSKKSASKSELASAKTAKTSKEHKSVKEPKEPKEAKVKTPSSDLDAYFLEGEGQSKQESALVGLAEERHAAQLAKHGVKNEDEIIKANLAHDKSGTEWGGAVNLEDDPDLEHPHP